MRPDYLVVGSGLTGATIARLLVDAGWRVVVVERRAHVGGNVHDFVHPSGIRVHTYGPHYFRTSSRRIWDFVNRFSDFYRFEAVIKTLVRGRAENWPVAASFIDAHVGVWSPERRGPAQNFEEACLAMMPGQVYEWFVKGYTEKQWGVPAHTLSAGLAKRFDVRADDDPRLVRHRYQGIPTEGYAVFMRRMLEGIPVLLNTDFLLDPGAFRAKRRVVFTGPIDELFGFAHGRLAYRGQRRVHTFVPDVDRVQPTVQLNCPDPVDGSHIRTIEWKHMTPAGIATAPRGSVLTTETPFTPAHPAEGEYPFPDEQNGKLYRRYKALAAKLPHVLVCGRLGEYRYYDMDQAMGRAMMLARRLLSVTARPAASLVPHVEQEGERSW